jgi:hypothetical protein
MPNELKRQEESLNILYAQWHELVANVTVENHASIEQFIIHKIRSLLKACKNLGKTELLVNVLNSINNPRLLNKININNRDRLEIHETWLWLAACADTPAQRDQYLAYYRAYMPRIPLEKHTYFLLSAKITENFVTHVLLGKEKPHPYIVLPDAKKLLTKSVSLYFYVQIFIEAHQKNEDTRNAACALAIFLASYEKYMSDIFPIFYKNNLIEAFYGVLEQALPKAKHPIYLLKVLIELGMILNKDISQYVHMAKSEALDSMQMKTLLRVCENTLHLENFQYESGLKQEKNYEKTGECLLFDAVGYMNPYNKQYEPEKALPLLMSALDRTPQLGDIFIEYIRCQLLLDPTYQVDKESLINDPVINQFFFKIENHMGLCWNTFLQHTADFNHQINTLVVLAQQVQAQLIKYNDAYQGKNLNLYKPSDFQTALGSPTKFLQNYYPSQSAAKSLFVVNKESVHNWMINAYRLRNAPIANDQPGFLFSNRYPDLLKESRRF